MNIALLIYLEIRGEADGDVISTNGGRYDVSLSQRSRKSVFWDEPPSLIRRCTWFYKGDNESHFTPYEENLCNKLEARNFLLTALQYICNL